MQKVEGVQNVQVSLKEGLTVLELRDGNHVTLEQLRKVIKNNGFVSKEAEAVAKGTVRGTAFEVSGTGERLTLSRAAQGADEGRWRLLIAAPK